MSRYNIGTTLQIGELPQTESCNSYRNLNLVDKVSWNGVQKIHSCEVDVGCCQLFTLIGKKTHSPLKLRMCKSAIPSREDQCISMSEIEAAPNLLSFQLLRV
jgi:hypothetical protein